MWLKKSSHLRAGIQMLEVFPIMFQKKFNWEAVYGAHVMYPIRTDFVPKGTVRAPVLVYNGLNTSTPPFPNKQGMWAQILSNLLAF